MLNIKKILLILIFLLSIWILGVSADDLRSQIVPNAETISIKGVDPSWNSWLWVIWGIVVYIKNSIFWLLSVIAIGMFIYTGFRLVKAEWNPEEMSKVWKTLIHVIVWLFIVAASWAIVAMVSGTKF